jgi:hypothetical protein
VAYRAGRKTPYETLKTLVEILDKTDHVREQDRSVLSDAVHREVQRIERLNKARIEGFWALQRERLVQSEGRLVWMFVQATVILLTCWVVFDIHF